MHSTVMGDKFMFNYKLQQNIQKHKKNRQIS